MLCEAKGPRSRRTIERASILPQNQLAAGLATRATRNRAAVFRRACKLGCEGIVSKQRASTYRSGRVRTWIKAKNPDSPAMTRVWEG